MACWRADVTTDRGRRLPALLAAGLLLCGAAARVGGDTLPESVTALLPAERDVFRVGIARLSGEGLSQEARSAAETFPRLLYEQIGEIDERDLSGDELEAYAAVRLRTAKRTAATRLRSAVAARDRLLFEPLAVGPAARSAARERLDRAEEAVDEARAVLDRLDATEPDDVPGAPRRPLEYWSGHEAGLLLSLDSTPHALAVDEDLDLLLWGSIEEIEGYLAVDLFIYHRFLERNTAAGSTVARPEDLSGDTPLVAGDVARAVLGRDFATLVVATRRADAETAAAADAAVRVGGVLRGFSRAEARFLRPGAHEIRVELGDRASVRVVELAPGERRVERVEPPPPVSRLVRLQSSPSGADVYADSVWVGRTPLEHEFPASSTIVRMRREGYLESRFVVNAGSPDLLSRALLPDKIDWTEELRASRDGFYQALTWFVLSVPVTVLLHGGFESVRAAFPASDSTALSREELDRLARRGNILYWSSIGARLLNAGLFVNLLLSVFDYLAVGEGPHNQ